MVPIDGPIYYSIGSWAQEAQTVFPHRMLHFRTQALAARFSLFVFPFTLNWLQIQAVSRQAKTLWAGLHHLLLPRWQTPALQIA